MRRHCRDCLTAVGGRPRAPDVRRDQAHAPQRTRRRNRQVLKVRGAVRTRAVHSGCHEVDRESFATARLNRTSSLVLGVEGPAGKRFVS